MYLSRFTSGFLESQYAQYTQVSAPSGYNSAMTQKAEDTKKCVSIIFNPTSGQSDPEQRRKIISDTLAQQGYVCQFINTTQETGARALAAQALEDGVDLLAVSGGDGTVMEALSALVGTDTPIAVLPAGTGNLLSVNLGIPVDGSRGH